MNKPRVKILVSGEVLLQGLHFPEDTELVAVLEDRRLMLQGMPTVELYLYHPDLPEVQGDYPILESKALWVTRYYSVFEDWGLGDE